MSVLFPRHLTLGHPGSRSPHLTRTISLRTRALAALTLLALATAPALAQSREDFAPAEALGMGDNVRATTWGPSALFFNPAGMSRAKALITQASYGYSGGRSGHAFSASAVDATTNPLVAMGISYGYVSSAPGGVDRDGSQFRSALSTSYATSDLAIYAGVGLRYLDLQIGAKDSAAEPRDDVDAWTIDAGLIFDLAGRIKLGVVGANLLDTKSSEAPRKLGLGMAFNFQTVELTGDVELDLADQLDGAVLTYGFGAQYHFAQGFQARLGVTFDQLNHTERLAGGLGFSMAEWALDLGYSSALSDPADMLYLVSLRYTPPMARAR